MMRVTGRLIDWWGARKKEYQHVLPDCKIKGSPGWKALVDFGEFCGAFKSGVIVNDHDSLLVMAGRREAYYWLVNHLHFEPDELIEMYKSSIRGGS